MQRLKKKNILSYFDTRLNYIVEYFLYRSSVQLVKYVLPFFLIMLVVTFYLRLFCYDPDERHQHVTKQKYFINYS